MKKLVLVKFALGLLIAFHSLFAFAADGRYDFNEEQIPLKDVVEELEKTGHVAYIKKIAILFAREYGLDLDEAALGAIFDQYYAAAKNDLAANPVPRFPLLPISKLNLITREALLAKARSATPPQIPPQAPPTLEKEVASLLDSSCPEQAKPLREFKTIPGLAEGHQKNPKLGKCLVHQSIVLSRLMTRLAHGEASSKEVKFKSASLSSAEDLMSALLQSGHQVTVRLEKTYADFLSLNFNGKSVIWPVWMDTEVSIVEKTDPKMQSQAPSRSLVIPAGHSQIAWSISGPDVNAEITYYLGVSGLGFQPRIYMRPRWTGWTPEEILATSKDNSAAVLASIAKAQSYAAIVQREASDLPNSGYGYIGVCNDAVAYILAGMDVTNSVYPLARSLTLPRLGTSPRDLDTSWILDRVNIRFRALSMQPVTEGAISLIDPVLRADLELLEKTPPPQSP